MKTVAILITAAALLMACSAVAFGVDAAADGKKVYEAKKCAMCHSIAGVGGKKGVLDGVGSKLKPEELKKWVLTPKEMKANSVMPATKGLSDKEVGDLVSYLGSLKK